MALGVQEMGPHRPGADIQGEDERGTGTHRRPASRAARMSGGKL